MNYHTKQERRMYEVQKFLERKGGSVRHTDVKELLGVHDQIVRRVLNRMLEKDILKRVKKNPAGRGKYHVYELRKKDKKLETKVEKVLRQDIEKIKFMRSRISRKGYLSRTDIYNYLKKYVLSEDKTGRSLSPPLLYEFADDVSRTLDVDILPTKMVFDRTAKKTLGENIAALEDGLSGLPEGDPNESE